MGEMGQWRDSRGHGQKTRLLGVGRGRHGPLKSSQESQCRRSFGHGGWFRKRAGTGTAWRSERVAALRCLAMPRSSVVLCCFGRSGLGSVGKRLEKEKDSETETHVESPVKRSHPSWAPISDFDPPTPGSRALSRQGRLPHRWPKRDLAAFTTQSLERGVGCWCSKRSPWSPWSLRDMSLGAFGWPLTNKTHGFAGSERDGRPGLVVLYIFSGA